MANPLDISKISQDPCTALTAAQLAPYMGDVRKKNNVSENKTISCINHPVDGHKPSISVTFFPDQGGPSGMENGAASFPFNKKVDQIAGYPAYHVSQGSNGPQTGDCQSEAAVSDKAFVTVYAQGSSKDYEHYTDMCTVSDALLTALIGNIKNGG
ncbi:hypothetical protein GCM10010174_30310 [Kutzneria viridogrisea]